jgi:hypothetical protein
MFKRALCQGVKYSWLVSFIAPDYGVTKNSASCKSVWQHGLYLIRLFINFRTEDLNNCDRVMTLLHCIDIFNVSFIRLESSFPRVTPVSLQQHQELYHYGAMTSSRNGVQCCQYCFVCTQQITQGRGSVSMDSLLVYINARSDPSVVTMGYSTKEMSLRIH